MQLSIDGKTIIKIPALPLKGGGENQHFFWKITTVGSGLLVHKARWYNLSETQPDLTDFPSFQAGEPGR